MARQQECQYCVPTWNLTDLTVTAYPYYEPSPLGFFPPRVNWELNVEWKACLEKLECSPFRGMVAFDALSVQANQNIPLPKFPARALVRTGNRLAGRKPREEGSIGSFDISKGIKFKGLADLGQAQVCCKEVTFPAPIGTIADSPESCCNFKRDNICHCYASYSTTPASQVPPTTQKECCMQGTFKHTIQTVDFAQDFLIKALRDDGAIRKGLAAKLQAVLKPIGGRGTDSTASCNGIDLDDATSQWNPEAFPNEWTADCVCRDAGDEMKCP